ncbi:MULTISPECIES: DUF917 family protein [Microbacterium]|uniref:S-methyl thiohydantoin desulfurase domain-containing protein n=1 Tax=Microbacterium TaxID=33882 RepID=UPI00278B2A68|nr:MULTISPECIES: DUF917 family protein [Microbacterium]MDQ1084956.1 DUF917 family protein [Microbacterium sp. SORGH_AS_0344]MDQ1169768.1 DUF917 family protein [Microbacterium proteolyticum]
MRTLGPERLSALARGFALLGAGGGGTTTLLELMAAVSLDGPVVLHDVDDLDPSTPCVAVGFAGSTYLLGERVPGDDAFAPLLTAAERWTGVAAAAVCAMEGAGLNGLTPFLLARGHTLVDADLMGRALPGVDQLSLVVDAVPGVVLVADTGGGVMVLESSRGADVESLVRASVIRAGGAGAVLVAGFTVGDLADHAIRGTFARALALGDADVFGDDLPGARMLGAGRVSAVDAVPDDPFARSVELTGDDGALLRLVARSEFLAVTRDGQTIAASPDILVAIDSVSGDVLQVDAVTLARHVRVLALAAPEWWTDSPERLSHVVPGAYGLRDLEVER